MKLSNMETAHGSLPIEESGAVLAERLRQSVRHVGRQD